MIFIGGKDAATISKLKVDTPVLTLGPYPLEEGLNRSWSSKSEHCYVAEKILHSRKGDKGDTRIGGEKDPLRKDEEFAYDIIICVAPANMLHRTDLFSPGHGHIHSKVRKHSDSVEEFQQYIHIYIYIHVYIYTLLYIYIYVNEYTYTHLYI
jgi:hypothetical protein